MYLVALGKRKAREIEKKYQENKISRKRFKNVSHGWLTG
jgi:hypothetical protein